MRENDDGTALEATDRTAGDELPEATKLKGCSALFRFLLGVASFALGLRLLQRDRNVFGNPSLEELIEECRTPGSNAVIRLYQGNGGATTAFSYSVTFKENVSSRERQIFYTYGTPTITSIDCDADGVVLQTYGTPVVLSLTEIKNDLIRKPVGLDYGEPVEPTIQPLRMTKVAFGVLSLGLAAVLAWSAHKKLAA